MNSCAPGRVGSSCLTCGSGKISTQAKSILLIVSSLTSSDQHFSNIRHDNNNEYVYNQNKMLVKW